MVYFKKMRVRRYGAARVGCMDMRYPVILQLVLVQFINFNLSYEEEEKE